MAQTPVDVGVAPNDGLGDPLRDAFIKVNNNDADLLSEIGTVSNRIKSATTTLLAAGNRTITFLTPFSDANYEVVFMALDANGLSSFPSYISQTATGFTINLSFDSTVTYIAHKN